LPYIDWIFFDLKIINGSAIDQKTPSPANHPANSQTYQLTNLPTYQLANFPIPHILENARRIASEFSGRLVFRLPVIPGFNDHAENIQETARFIHSIGRNEINLLPLHHLGREKYSLLDKKYYTTDFKIPGKTDLQKIADQFGSLGITCYIGSETPF
jgi:pyruvate-formate lyase-activating enzyme